MLKSVQHPHIIGYFGSFLHRGALHILLEYAETGDLFSVLKRQKEKHRHFA